jgi:hypothetical protein
MRNLCTFSVLLLFSLSANAYEVMTQYNHFLTSQNADTLITTEGLDGQNTKFIVGKYQVNVFQPCGVKQYGAFTMSKAGICGRYKAGSQMWIRAANNSNLNTNGIAVRVYPSSTPVPTIYATPDSEYFIVGNPVSYMWQDCTNADSINYQVVAVAPCTSGLVLWKRTTQIQ